MATTNSNSNERLMKILQATPEQQAAIDRVLEGKAPTKIEVTGPLLLGMSAAAKFLGVSRPTLWRMLKHGRFPKVEILPGSFRIRRADLEIFVGGKESGQ
jgi:excisionase family DNA binding protein